MKTHLLIAFLMFVPVFAGAQTTNAIVPEACQENVQQLLDTLLPFAQQLAGKPIHVTITGTADDQTALAQSGSFADYVLGETADRIRISATFCTFSRLKQRVFISHELGHGIDRVDIATYYNGNPAAAPIWSERPVEIAATARALQLYDLAGYDTDDFKFLSDTPYFAKHMETAKSLASEFPASFITINAFQ